jgi:hypothetical protein
MNYTKIIMANRTWMPIITGDLNVQGQPLFTLSDRFQVFPLQIIRHSFNGQLIAYKIIGDVEANKERLLVFFEIKDGVVEEYILQKLFAMDGEAAKYIAFALIMKLRKDGRHTFSGRILPEKQNK